MIEHTVETTVTAVIDNSKVFRDPTACPSPTIKSQEYSQKVNLNRVYSAYIVVLVPHPQ